METIKKEAESANEVCERSVEAPTSFDRAIHIEVSEKKQSFLSVMLLGNLKTARIVGESFTLWTIVIALLAVMALEFEVGGTAVINLIPDWLLR